MTRTTRRDLFAAASFTALAGGAAVTIGVSKALPLITHTDAELIASCNRIIALNDELDTTYADWENDDPEEIRLEAIREALLDQQRDLLDETRLLRATTIQGH